MSHTIETYTFASSMLNFVRSRVAKMHEIVEKVTIIKCSYYICRHCYALPALVIYFTSDIFTAYIYIDCCAKFDSLKKQV